VTLNLDLKRQLPLHRDWNKTGTFCHLDFLTALNTNTDGWGNKLVTIFADHTQTVIMKKKPSHILVNLLAAGGLDSVKSGLKTYTWICKNCAMVACRRDNFVTKVPRLVPADCTTNVYSLNRRAVSGNACCGTKLNINTL
jgi:hypothetical protein